MEKARRTTEENEQKAAAAATQIEAVRQQAATLQAQVQEYTQQFESFQKQLDNRSEALAAGNAELEQLRMGLGDKDKEVSELIGKATEMLGGATVAGLSAAYKSQMDKVDGQLKNARYFYYFSIVLLILSVLVALNVFSPFDVGLSPCQLLATPLPLEALQSRY